MTKSAGLSIPTTLTANIPGAVIPKSPPSPAGIWDNTSPRFAFKIVKSFMKIVEERERERDMTP